MAKQLLDYLDRQILKLISQDARIPFLEVARACNVSGAAIHQRVAKLTNLGIIKGSQFIIDPEKIGYETCAYVGLYLKNPEQFDHVVDELRKIPEVVECHYTTGGMDMFMPATTITCWRLSTTSCNHWACHAVRPSSHSMQLSTDSCHCLRFLRLLRTRTTVRNKNNKQENTIGLSRKV